MLTLRINQKKCWTATKRIGRKVKSQGQKLAGVMRKEAASMDDTPYNIQKNRKTWITEL